ncbi:ATP synthase subunit b precursor [Roseovarius gaetbuli]|uniref:ATP synthase subunit b n=1 Tax=Roseovarius gaetbuli TaxID=1356575 RepID=A0A1X7A378_9RHOB|nr:F0F1 ATP synthase subunit B [Roseovarius gaetbuli]SLN68800.1 ATP synthase subunit b precursor [Roseovarius gaetbuli]
MRKILATLAAATLASPALAASGPFVSLANTNFIVLISFLIFVGFLVYLKVPGMLGKKLDERAEGIQAELDEARSLREEAQTLLASYERKQKEVQEQADRIVAHAKEEAAIAADQAKADLKDSIARRLQSAEDQIGSAESRAIREVRDQAVSIAVAAAKDVIAKQMTAAEGNSLIDSSIAEVNAKLH